MKKAILIMAAAIVCSTNLRAQDSATIISLIEKAYTTPKAVNTNFSEIYTSYDKTVPQKERKGELSYDGGNIEMNYTNGDKFVIIGNTMTIKTGSQTNTFDLTKNIMMRGLSHTLDYAFEGQLNKLAEEQNADITATRDGDYYLITLTARKKAPRGYSSIVAYYRVKDCLINSMRMDEFNGASTYYTISK